MLTKFQSAAAIKDQISKGVSYYLITYDGKNAGYFSIIKENESLFLSKFYVLKELRGQGIGKKALAFIRNEATLRGCTTISLTVNKNNSNAIKAYEKIGFTKIDSVVTPIGNNFVMDDYVMEYRFVKKG
ncbi:MAG: GNAT family N-acetyltransferase [Eudoraea sp.]|nr:GNAT family N-acetyltransferase [Eudoraea sp.]